MSEAICAVCGAAVDTGGRPGLLFQGRQWFFCGPACRLGFKREPERWVGARPEAGFEAMGGGTPSPPPRTRTASPFRVRGGP